MAIVAKVCNAGLPFLINALDGGQNGLVLYLAVGTGAGTADPTDTAIFTEDTSTARILCVLTRVTTNVPNDTLNAAATALFPSINETLTNLGLFDASAHNTGNLYYIRTGLILAVGPTAGVSGVNFSEDIILVPV